MFILSDVITYMRRLLKTPNNASITDDLLIDYINRFYINDVDARIQLFDLKTKYQFVTQPGVDVYNMPLYDLQVEQGNQPIRRYPLYQGFTEIAYINGINVSLQTQKQGFYNIWPNIVQQNNVVATGNGGAFYSIQLPILPATPPPNPPFNAILRGHIDITGIIANSQNGSFEDPPLTTNFITNIPVTSVEARVFIFALGPNGQNMLVTDSGQFFEQNVNLGLLMNPGLAPLGNTAASGGYGNMFTITAITLGNPTVITAVNTLNVGQTVEINSIVGTVELNGGSFVVLNATPTSVTLDVNSTLFTPYISGGTLSVFQNFVNYLTGKINVVFPDAVPEGNNINVQCFFFQGGLPRAILFYNNCLYLRTVPDSQYLVELDAYLSPAAFLASNDAIPFGYMSEYIARGAARKIMSDTGDVEQFQFYEPLFREQEMLVWKRSQRQWTASRTQSIYALGLDQGLQGNTHFNGGTI